jgi:hypothetical protein
MIDILFELCKKLDRSKKIIILHYHGTDIRSAFAVDTMKKKEGEVQVKEKKAIYSNK